MGSNNIFFGCARGPFDTPTPTLPPGTPTPTPLSPTLHLSMRMAASVDPRYGYYVFAFNRPPQGRVDANPVTVNRDETWTDYIQLGINFGSSTPNFVRNERLIPGDVNSNFQQVEITFNDGSYSGDTVEAYINMIDILDNPPDLYINVITFDSTGYARDALGPGLGTSADSYRVNLELTGVIYLNDTTGDVIMNPAPPTDFNRHSFDIVQVALQILK